ncbi:nuclear transport factor 2 family protein [Mesorhizobium sp. VK24D]|uniref:Nuclear transport factor 2 family protein n=1 Tax=Mesorhizobium album TaxID=3072314 RepID=A0ABU4Y8D4_9HYPH|nr:nuclear transport factor 2 family protein [Mesorhizobium sp. VK24D]MDX8482167.1 nuclear transport factor 2 family protein [Mesorhizobium sp. VK24D]
MNDEADRRPAHDPQDLARLLVSRQQAGDAEAMAALYEPGAILDIGGGQLARGREAIHDFYAKLAATRQKFELGDQRPAIVKGELALTSTRLHDGTVTVEIARRQGDGTWLWAIDQPSILP